MPSLTRRHLLDHARRLVAAGALAALAPRGLRPSAAAAACGEGGAAMVETMAALRRLGPCPDGARVRLLGHHAPDDGGGGDFRWDAAGAGNDDGGLVLAPEDAPAAGRWVRVLGDRLSLRWFGAKGDGVADDAPALAAALAAATERGLPLYAPAGTYLLDTDVTQVIPEGRRLEFVGEGATFRRVSNDKGILIFEAEQIATPTLTATLVQGTTQVEVSDTAGIRPGDMVGINFWLNVSDRGGSWVMGEYNIVERIDGNVLHLAWKSNFRVNPKRRLDYRLDGSSNRVHYRTWWVPAEAVEVYRNGAPQRQGWLADYRLVPRAADGTGQAGFDIVFRDRAATLKGDIVTLQTRTDVIVKVFRGGRLRVAGLRFECDREEADFVTFIRGNAPCPRHAVFEDLDFVEHNPDMHLNGFATGHGGDLFYPTIVDGTVRNVRTKGARYCVRPSGRMIRISNIRGRDSWHTVAIFAPSSDTYIDDVESYNCVAAVDSHWSNKQHLNNVRGKRFRHGLNLRANGGSIRNCNVESISTDPDDPMLRMGPIWGAPMDDKLLIEPLDNPINMFIHAISGVENDVLIENSRFAAPNAPGGFRLDGSYLNQVVLRNVVTDGALDFDGNGPPPVEGITIENVTCAEATLRACKRIRARGLITGLLRIPALGGIAGADFEDCTFDGRRGEEKPAGHLIVDGQNALHLTRTFKNCTFKNSEHLFEPGSLLATEQESRAYQLTDCTFDLGAGTRRGENTARRVEIFPPAMWENAAGGARFEGCRFLNETPVVGYPEAVLPGPPTEGYWREGSRIRRPADSGEPVLAWRCVTGGVALPDAAEWRPGTSYRVGDLVWARNSVVRLLGLEVGANDLVYKCVGAGASSAADGPRGTDSGISDGLVRWDFYHPRAVFAAQDG